MSDSDDDEMEKAMDKFSELDTKTKEEITKEKQINFIKSSLRAYPELRLTPDFVYDRESVIKDRGFNPAFRGSVTDYLHSLARERGLLTIGRKRRQHAYENPSENPSENPPRKSSRNIEPDTTIEPGMGAGGNKSRRNTRRRIKSKKQKRVRHTRRKKTRRHRHSRRR